MLDIHLDDRQVSFLIGTDHLGVVLHSGGIILKTHANAIRFLHHVTVGKDEAFGIHHHSRSQRAFANGAAIRPTRSAGPTLSARAGLASRTAEEAVEEVLHAAAVLFVSAALPAPAPVHVLHGRFGVDVDHAGLELLRDLGKGVRHLLRRGHGQGRRIALLPLFAFNSLVDDSSNENADCQSCQDTQRVGRPMGLHAHPHCAHISLPPNL